MKAMVKDCVYVAGFTNEFKNSQGETIKYSQGMFIIDGEREPQKFTIHTDCWKQHQDSLVSGKPYDLVFDIRWAKGSNGAYRKFKVVDMQPVTKASGKQSATIAL